VSRLGKLGGIYSPSWCDYATTYCEIYNRIG
jgi:hypothetical protein